MNLLLTSAGRRGYIVDYFKQALKGQGQVHAANSVLSPALMHADQYMLTPPIYDDRYIDCLLEYSLANDIRAIIPLFDIDLPVLAGQKERLRRHGIKVIVSDYEITQICNDKWRTVEFFRKNEIAIPETFTSLDDAYRAISDGSVRFPLILKPRWGMGSIGICCADVLAELEPMYRKVEHAVNTSYLRYESEKDIEHSVIIQEKMEGIEYGLDVINDLSGCYVTTLVKRKISMRYGETDVAVTEDNEAMRNIGRRLSDRLKHIANLDVDCFWVDNKVYVLEMNCRFGGGYPFSHLAGANLPLAVISWIKGQVPDKKLFKINYGVESAKDITPIVMRNEKYGS